MAFNFETSSPFVLRNEFSAAGTLSAGNTVAVTNKASGGTIGSAATTVDVAQIITINQTTASQTVTIPDPTNTAVRTLIFINIGNTAVTVLGASLAAGGARLAVWTGTAWKAVS